MSRTLKIVLIVCGSGLLVIAVLAWALFRYVSSHKDEWVAEGRDMFQEGVAAGKTLRDSECLDEAFVRHDDGRGGFAGIGAHLWLNGCLQNATPTSEFCHDVPQPNEIADTVSWVMQACARRGLPNDSSCNRMLREVQSECAKRAAP